MNEKDGLMFFTHLQTCPDIHFPFHHTNTASFQSELEVVLFINKYYDVKTKPYEL